MAKFKTTTNEESIIAKPAMDQVPAATKGAAASIPTSYNESSFSRPSTSSATQLSEAAQLAKIELEKKQWEAENDKQNENWMKTMWRPAMGWLYMVMCFCDFVAFPVIAMFLPQFIPSMTYIPWKSITLDNGGLIHMAFGAILGVAAWTRGQEKIAGKA
jgi:hypothetical protein